MAASSNPIISSMQNTVTEEFIGTTLKSDILRTLVNETLNEERRKQNAERALLFANDADDINLEYVRNLLYKKSDNYLPNRTTRKFSLVPSFLLLLWLIDNECVLVETKLTNSSSSSFIFVQCSPEKILSILLLFLDVAIKCFNVVYFFSLNFSPNIDFEQEYYYSLNKTPNSRMYLTDSQDVSSLFFLNYF